MRSLTKMELICISPLLLNIQIYRSRATQVPSSIQGSIAYPLKDPMEARSLPWYDFHNLPFIIVHVHQKNEKHRQESKVDLRKIVRAIEWMSEIVEFQGMRRARNRLVSDGLCNFVPGNITRLKEQLGGIDDDEVFPQGIREITISEDSIKMSEPITKDLMKLWFKSHYPFAQAVVFAVRDELAAVDGEVGTPLFDIFWNSLTDYSLSYFQSKIITLQNNDDDTDEEINIYKEWIQAGTVITAHTLTSYAETKNI